MKLDWADQKGLVGNFSIWRFVPLGWETCGWWASAIVVTRSPSTFGAWELK